ncbi:cytochrome c maturation protein CcmE [Chelativorans sp. AA-79]|uniref:cytochrome c maturation protein CcmE n=1 Tax=Chelativorans sp. AA-79 TaxID=3028735 RepID=UPI0023F8C8B3|nr:cytochrome c maturation protein CcmE [Chelativorans sp. AA-79]WEX07720.1 cytochrome c maturation protein CcmE [Chelativorans sp. AA-79]
MTRKQKRLAIIGSGMGFLALAAGLTFYALGQQTSYFYMPADLLSQSAAAGERIRLGGLVQKGSIERGEATHVRFVVTDSENEVPVVYDGILPDLFREEQGVVTEGVMGSDGVFVADTVLAKHDETYMPREVADRLKEDGLWQEQ